MTENERLIKIVLEDDFGRTVTKVKTRLSPPMLMDKILELEEVEWQRINDLNLLLEEYRTLKYDMKNINEI